MLVLSGHSDRNVIVFYFSSILITNTYLSLCPVNVDSHLNVPVKSSDQIFTVLSTLPLASLPSSLHATDKTLQL